MSPRPPAWIYPIRYPGRPPGDGFLIRHGFQTENTWYNPGDWHTGEDWYALEDDTAGAEIVAVAPGVVDYADGNYPGRVVIVRHADHVYSMYGHLDNALSVAEGQTVERGQLLGTVLRRGDDTPNHLHFELRSFFTADPVNGPAPRYAYRCGPQCAPGPGYWPISAPELPGAVGWFNPTHQIARNAWPEPGTPGEVVVATAPVSPTLDLYAAVDENGVPSEPSGTLALEAGSRYTMLESRAGPQRPPTTSAESYSLWYRLALPDGRDGWVAGLAASANDTGSDGRPSSVRFNFLPVADTTF